MQDSLTVPEYLRKLKRLTTIEEKVVYLWMGPKIWSREKEESITVLVRMLCNEAEKGNDTIVSEVKKILARKVIPMLKDEDGNRAMPQNPQADVKSATDLFIHFFAQGIDRTSIFNHPDDEDKILKFLGELWGSSLYLASDYWTLQIEQALIAYRLPPFLIDHGVVRLLPDLYYFLLQDSKGESDTLGWSGWKYFPIEYNGMISFKSTYDALHLEKQFSGDQSFFDDYHKMLELAGAVLSSGPYHFISRGIVALVAKAMYLRKQVMAHVWTAEHAYILCE